MATMDSKPIRSKLEGEVAYLQRILVEQREEKELEIQALRETLNQIVTRHAEELQAVNSQWEGLVGTLREDGDGELPGGGAHTAQIKDQAMFSKKLAARAAAAALAIDRMNPTLDSDAVYRVGLAGAVRCPHCGCDITETVRDADVRERCTSSDEREGRKGRSGEVKGVDGIVALREQVDELSRELERVQSQLCITRRRLTDSLVQLQVSCMDDAAAGLSSVDAPPAALATRAMSLVSLCDFGWSSSSVGKDLPEGVRLTAGGRCVDGARQANEAWLLELFVSQVHRVAECMEAYCGNVSRRLSRQGYRTDHLVLEMVGGKAAHHADDGSGAGSDAESCHSYQHSRRRGRHRSECASLLDCVLNIASCVLFTDFEAEDFVRAGFSRLLSNDERCAMKLSKFLALKEKDRALRGSFDAIREAKFAHFCSRRLEELGEWLQAAALAGGRELTDERMSTALLGDEGDEFAAASSDFVSFFDATLYLDRTDWSTSDAPLLEVEDGPQPMSAIGGDLRHDGASLRHEGLALEKNAEARSLVAVRNALEELEAHLESLQVRPPFPLRVARFKTQSPSFRLALRLLSRASRRGQRFFSPTVPRRAQCASLTWPLNVPFSPRRPEQDVSPAERELALMAVEAKRQELLQHLLAHQGREWQVVQELLGFIGDTSAPRTDLSLPPYTHPTAPGPLPPLYHTFHHQQLQNHPPASLATPLPAPRRPAHDPPQQQTTPQAKAVAQQQQGRRAEARAHSQHQIPVQQQQQQQRRRQQSQHGPADSSSSMSSSRLLGAQFGTASSTSSPAHDDGEVDQAHGKGATRPGQARGGKLAHMQQGSDGGDAGRQVRSMVSGEEGWWSEGTGHGGTCAGCMRGDASGSEREEQSWGSEVAGVRGGGSVSWQGTHGDDSSTACMCCSAAAAAGGGGRSSGLTSNTSPYMSTAAGRPGRSAAAAMAAPSRPSATPPGPTALLGSLVQRVLLPSCQRAAGVIWGGFRMGMGGSAGSKSGGGSGVMVPSVVVSREAVVPPCDAFPATNPASNPPASTAPATPSASSTSPRSQRQRQREAMASPSDVSSTLLSRQALDALGAAEAAVSQLETSLTPIVDRCSSRALAADLAPMDRAKAHLVTAHAAASLFCLVLRSYGMAPSEHGVAKDMARIDSYVHKVRLADTAGGAGDGAVGAPTSSLNVAAANRFIVHAIPDLTPEQRRLVREAGKKRRPRGGDGGGEGTGGEGEEGGVGGGEAERAGKKVKSVRQAAEDFLAMAAADVATEEGEER
ncbi:unnamed protein product [Closterium sp. NIES-64]|nr:unnamed protein product [Closterium sp. NIES-64]